MAILGMDGFDHYGTADTIAANEVAGYQISAYHSTDCLFTGTDTRWGSGNMLLMDNGKYFSVAVGSTVTDTMIIGFAFRIQSFNTRQFLEYRAHGDSDIQLQFRIKDSGEIEVLRRNSVVLATSTNVLTEDVYYWIEIKAKIDPSVGTVEVRVNGTSTGWINATGLNTQYSATAPLIGAFRLWAEWGGTDLNFDDLIWQDDAGDFLGDTRIETFMPAADSSVAWSRSAGSTNYENIDEIGPSDVDYVHSNTAAQVDLYDVGALSADDTVHAVAIHTRAKKDATGARSIESRTKSSTDEQGGVDNALSTDFVTYADIYETYDGTNAWTKTLFDAAQFGVKVTL